MKRTLFIGILLILAGCDGLSTGKNTEDKVNTNNTIDKASVIAIDDSVSIKFSEASTEFYYTFTVQGHGALLHVQLKDVPSKMITQVKLYDSEQKTLKEKAYESSTPDFSYNYEPGTYYLKIRSLSGYNSTGVITSLRLEQDEYDTHEYNNDFENAARLEFGQTYASKKIPSNDVDMFTFSVEKNAHYTIKIDSVSSHIDLQYTIYDDEGVKLYNYKTGTGNDVTKTVSLRSGLYYVGFGTQWDIFSSQKPYFFTLSEYQPDSTEWNNTSEMATQYVVGDTVFATIFPIYDKDWFKFSIEDSGDYSVYVTNNSKKTLLEINIYDDEVVRFSWWYIANNSSTKTLDLNKGTYFIAINDRYNDDYSEKGYEYSIQPKKE